MKYLFTLLLGLALFACEANEADEVPAAVMSAFEAAYPNATDVEWEEEDGTYEVEFEMNGEEMEAYYSATGELLDEKMDQD